jgi:hypothetical protein
VGLRRAVNHKEIERRVQCRPGIARHEMTLFVLSIPIMILMVALAVVPLIVMSKTEQREIASHARASDGAQRGRVDVHSVEPTLTITA